MNGSTLLTLGHGYSAAALAASLPHSWNVLGVTRSIERAAAMRAVGVEPLDATDRVALADAIGSADYILASAPPGEDGDPFLNEWRGEIEASPARWIGYLSSTGVYGDRQGAWVGEDDPPKPGNPRSARRVPAERAWVDLRLPAHIFRIAGIYGPGRSALDRLRAGVAQRVVKSGQVFCRIHVEDIATVLRASIDAPNPGRVYNVADDEPAPPQDVVTYAAQLLDVQPPPQVTFETANLSKMARSFYSESKRIRNDRIQGELGVDLRYPNYRVGLRALIAEEN